MWALAIWEAPLKQDIIRLSPSRGADIAAIMNQESDRPDQYVERIYWTVSPAAVRGVLDHIRTALVKLVAELRSHMGLGRSFRRPRR